MKPSRSLLCAAMLVMSSLAGAQPWPDKPVHLVVPYPPGGNVDSAARAIAPKLQEALGLWPGHLDRGVEVKPELFTTDWITRAYDQAVIESLGIAGDERFREEDDLGLGNGGVRDQAHRLGYARVGIEWHRAGLHHGYFYTGLFGRGSHGCFLHRFMVKPCECPIFRQACPRRAASVFT